MENQKPRHVRYIVLFPCTSLGPGIYRILPRFTMKDATYFTVNQSTNQSINAHIQINQSMNQSINRPTRAISVFVAFSASFV
jgi:hypothetical protein